MGLSQAALPVILVCSVTAVVLIVVVLILVVRGRVGAAGSAANAANAVATAAVVATLEQQMLILQQKLDAQQQQIQALDATLVRMDTLIREEFARSREEALKQGQATREETTKTLLDSRAATEKSLLDSRTAIEQTLLATREETTKALRENREELSKQFKEIRESMETRLSSIQKDNSDKLEEMRKTVDEKLQETVEKRFSESFTLISERLEQVHKGLGEMQTLASGVGDLKKVLSNVKTRGNLGEYQLGAILEQILSPEQYLINAQTKKRSQERVEFAVKLPGRSDDDTDELLLPIDSKFPIEDYERLLDVYEGTSSETQEAVSKRLEISLKKFAREIRDKYLNPPRTTDFAIMFVPTEGLYAEVLRMPGLFDTLQREFHVTVVGPTNLVAFLSSLQMGFRTLAVEKRSSEVWKLLGQVKTEFGKFEGVLENVKRKLAAASNEIDKAGTRTNIINRRLRKVQELPAAEDTYLLDDPDTPIDVDGIDVLDGDSSEH
jgi:DNA recombination protein RmuC